MPDLPVASPPAPPREDVVRPSFGMRRLDRDQLIPWLVAALIAVVVYVVLDHTNPGVRRVTAVLLPTAVIVLWAMPRRWIQGLAVIAAGWLVAAGAVSYLVSAVGQTPPVGQAVGGAAFYDTPYQGGQYGAVASVAIPVLVSLAAVALSWLSHRRDGTLRDTTSPTPATDRIARAGRAWPMWLGAAVLAFTLVPDLAAYLRQESTPLPYGWDTANLIAWQGFVAEGLTPMKDFFYPYGFQWLFTLRNFGPMAQWFAQVAMIAIATRSLWQLSGRRPWRVLACLLVLIVMGAWNAELWRYFPAMLIAFTYAALGPPGAPRSWTDRLVFTLACVLAALIEPDMVATGLIGVALIVAGQLVAGELSWRRGRLLVDGIADAIPIAIAVAILLVIWVLQGTTSDNLHFFSEFSAVSAQSATLETVYGPLGLMKLYPDQYTIAAVAPALLAVAALWWAWWSPHERASVRALLLGGSGVGLSLLLKNFVRPIGDLELLPILLALSWSILLLWPTTSLLRLSAWAACVGATACLFDEGGVATQYLDSAVKSPAHAVSSIEVALNRPERIRAATAEFSAARFTGWPDLAIADWLLAAAPHGTTPSFAIFGDSPMTYVLLHQRPPYQTDMYDAGRISEQRTMLSDLERSRPAYMVYRFDFAQDGFPYDIRDPLVFAWMIRNYVPVKSYPIADILRRRAPGEPIAAAFWTARMGALEDLEYVPSLSTAAQSPTCSAGPGCARYVMADGRAAPTSLVVLDIRGDGRAFEVEFRDRAGVADYPIRLDRLWFAPLVGPDPTVTSTTAGFTTRLIGFRTGGNLY